GAARRSGGPRPGRWVARGRGGEPARVPRAAPRAAGRRPRDLRPRAAARAQLLHGDDLRGLRSGRRLRARRGRPLRRPARSLRRGATGVRRGPRRAARPPGAARGGEPGERGHGVSTGGLVIAIPRGNLFAETLDLLDRLGASTKEIRENERKLVFEDEGILTVRPSDVPTYVEHGAADLGITGKDVLLEQSEREVYELFDLGYGHCRMIVAAPAAADPLGEPLRRRGIVRVATTYPRAAELRALVPPARDVEDAVREIVAEIKSGGDAAVRSLTERFDHAELGPAALAVPPAEIEAAISTLEPGALGGLRLAIENVRAVAEAQLRELVSVTLPEGQEVTLVEQPVRRAAAYVPGGRAPYPSTVVMCATTAPAAGVDELAVCAPPGPEGRAHPAILAACGLCGV